MSIKWINITSRGGLEDSVLEGPELHLGGDEQINVTESFSTGLNC